MCVLKTIHMFHVFLFSVVKMCVDLCIPGNVSPIAHSAPELRLLCQCAMGKVWLC